jgi:Mat/Ecp fimbriae major subunit
MMTKIKSPIVADARFISFVCLAIFAPVETFAAPANVPTSAIVIPPLSLSEPAELRFGSVSSSFVSGTAVVDLPTTLPAVAPTTSAPINNSTRSFTGGTSLIGGNTCSVSVLCGAASVQIAGLANGTYSSVTVPSTFSVISGADSMTVGTMRVRYGILGTTGVTLGPGSLSASGTGLLVITGTLFVNATQASGNYTGTINVTVDY